MTVRNPEDCEIEWENNSRNVTESRYFYAKENKEGASCETDDPLYIKINDSWQIRGIINVIYDFLSNNCNIKRSILYEDTAFYAKWIQEQMKN